jgi:hypothetical protein
MKKLLLSLCVGALSVTAALAQPLIVPREGPDTSVGLSAPTFHDTMLAGAEEDAAAGAEALEEVAAAAPAPLYRQVIAGERYTCVLRRNGTVACWGANDFGEATPPAGSSPP